jgi:hypothetical protein
MGKGGKLKDNDVLLNKRRRVLPLTAIKPSFGAFRVKDRYR